MAEVKHQNKDTLNVKLPVSKMSQENTHTQTTALSGSKHTHTGALQVPQLARVPTETRQGLDGRGLSVRVQTEVRDFYLHQKVQIASTAPRASYTLGILGCLSGGETARAGNYHSHPPRAEVKNDEAITPFPHTPSWLGSQLIKTLDKFPIIIIIIIIMKNGIFWDVTPCDSRKNRRFGET
jgi:hypothetical protein